MVFHVLGKLRKHSSKPPPPGIEQKKTNDTSLGDTIPTKHQFYLETPVKKAPDSVEKLLLSFGHSPGEGIRTSSSVSSLSSNSASTYDLPRRKSIEASDDDSADTTKAAYPMAMCAPHYFEKEAPPLKDAKHVPASFWSTLFECCHGPYQPEPTYCSTAPTDKSLLGRFLEEEDDLEDWETNQVIQKNKRGIFKTWKTKRTVCGGGESAFFPPTEES